MIYCFCKKKYANFEIAALFSQLQGKGKRAAISKQTCFSQKRVRSYIVLALGVCTSHSRKW